jgi:hypothetical protein
MQSSAGCQQVDNSLASRHGRAAFLIVPSPLSTPALEHMSDVSGVRVHHRSHQFHFFTTDTADPAGVVVDNANHLSSKYFHDSIPSEVTHSCKVTDCCCRENWENRVPGRGDFATVHKQIKACANKPWRGLYLGTPARGGPLAHVGDI